MDNYYNKYGKIIISKGTTLYHWSDDESITDFNDVLFTCLTNSSWYGSYLYEFELLKDVELILTIKNENIIKKNIYESKFKYQDKQILTTIFNEIFTGNYYSIEGDVSLKKNKKNFKNLCCQLHQNNYHGLFNYIDSEKGQFEIVIFKPDIFLKLIKKTKKINLISDDDCKKKTYEIMTSNNISYEYSTIYEYKNIDEKSDDYKSIFYYIYKKKNYI